MSQQSLGDVDRYARRHEPRGVGVAEVVEPDSTDIPSRDSRHGFGLRIEGFRPNDTALHLPDGLPLSGVNLSDLTQQPGSDEGRTPHLFAEVGVSMR